MSSSSPILIVGAGVLGLATAARLALDGQDVVVIDPGGLNASALAAGMIAPAMESVLENVPAERAALLREARDLWPGFARDLGVELVQEGAEWRGPDLEDMARRLTALGFEARIIEGAVFTPDDWRIRPEAALEAMGQVPGITRIQGQVQDFTAEDGGWRLGLNDGASLWGRQAILATGAAAALPGLPPTARHVIDLIQPIRGQLHRMVGPVPPRVIRGKGAYAVPAEDGVIVGATMDMGRRDLDPDPAQDRALNAAASAFWGIAGDDDGAPLVGIRGASPDGLPIAGALGGGLFAALAPRRNGWLLAPAVAAAVAAAFTEGTKTAFTAAFDPARF